jgi:RimJ/RimL family protein N-acetyltransferase
LELLNLACERLFAESQAVAIDGFVKQSNAASVRLFSAAGFRHLGVETVGGQLAIHFSLEKSIKR